MAVSGSNASEFRTRWLNLTCPACSTPFRARYSMLDTGCDCPFCGVPYTDSSAEPSPPQPAQEEPAQRQNPEVISKPQRRKEKPPQEVAPTPPSALPEASTPPKAVLPLPKEHPPRPEPLPQPADPPAPGTAKRVQLPKARPPKPQAPAPPPAEKPTLRPEPAVPIQAKPADRGRTKHTKRIRKAGTTQRLLQRSLQIVVGAAIVFIGILITNSFFTAGKIIGGAADPGPAPTVEPAPAPESVLLPGEAMGAAETVRACFLAGSIDERIRYVRNPETVRPMMEHWYARYPVEPAVLGKVLREKKVEVATGLHIIMLAMEVPGTGYEFFAVEKMADGSYKVDWPVSSGYQAMPLEDFRNERPDSPVPFRVKAKLSDYYNYQFADPSIYQCVELYYPGDDTFKLYGYIDRTNSTVAPLIERLGFGPMSLMLELKFPPSAARNDQVEIGAVVAYDWFTE